MQTRESYTRYGGFSLADDNFHRIVDAVRRLRANDNLAALKQFATTLTLGKGGLVASLWEDDLHRVAMEPQDEKKGFPFAVAARRLRIFLDYLLSQTRSASHLLVGKRFDPILSPGEKHLRDA